MAIKVRTVRGGDNTYNTPAEDFNWLLNKLREYGVLDDLNGLQGLGVRAQSSPNMSVKVLAGNAILQATPTSESERTFGAELTVDSDVTIQSNTSGSTKYDKILLKLDADDLHNPPADGDFGEAASLITERHNAAGEAVTATNAIELAEVTVINNETDIANGDITDKRRFLNDGWRRINVTLTRTGNNAFTAPGDWRRILSSGDKFMCSQGGTKKYFYVSAITYNAATDVSTFAVQAGTEYVLASGTIDSPFFSKIQSPLDFPAYFTLVSNKQYFKMDGKELIVFGWDWKLGNNGTNMTQTQSLGLTFGSAPVVKISSAGQRSGSDPSVIGDLTSQPGWITYDSVGITATQFTAGFSKARTGDDSAQSLSNTVRFGYVYEARGTF